MINPAFGTPKVRFDPAFELEAIKTAFAGEINRPLLIVGNGPSASRSSLYQSLMDESGHPPVVFRMNWFFLETRRSFGPKVDGYFFSTSVASMENRLLACLKQEQYDINRILAPMHNRLELGAINIPQYDPWLLLASNNTVGECLFTRPLPTTGLQALASGLMLGFKSIHLTGFDFYSHAQRRYAYDIPEIITSTLTPKDIVPGYEKNHSRETDFAFLKHLTATFPNAKITLESDDIDAHAFLKPTKNMADVQVKKIGVQSVRAQMNGPHYLKPSLQDLSIVSPNSVSAKNITYQPWSFFYQLGLDDTAGKNHSQDLVELLTSLTISDFDSNEIFTDDFMRQRAAIILEGNRKSPALLTMNSSNNRAYITFATPEYYYGALALIRSLRRLTQTDIILLTTAPEVFAGVFVNMNVKVIRVETIANPNAQKKKARFENVYTKLEVFRQSDYERLIYIDADAIVLNPIEHLFASKGFWASPDWGVSLSICGFNSGVMVFSPSENLYQDMIKILSNTESYDGGDQGFLNAYFPNWNVLPFRYNCLRRLAVSYPQAVNLGDVAIFHYVGQKPWLTGYVQKEEAVYDILWMKYFSEEEILELIKYKNKLSLQNINLYRQSMLEEYISPRWSLIESLLKGFGDDALRYPFETMKLIPRKIRTLTRLIFKSY